MTSRPARAPGLAFEAVRPEPVLSPLRSDIAAFVGGTRRGPIDVPVRVEGWRGYLKEFGDLDSAMDVPYAVRGYFDNGGEIAWIVRISGPATVASAVWSAIDLADIPAGSFRVEAASPGAWANGLRVAFTYRGRTVTGAPSIDVQIRAADGEVEDFRSVAANELVTRIAERSRLIRMVPLAPPGVTTARGFAISSVILSGGTSSPAEASAYLGAIDLLDEVPEVALLAFPDVYALGEAPAASVFQVAAQAAEVVHDRMVLVDLPKRPERWHADRISEWVRVTLAREDDDLAETVTWWRAAALYHPWVRVSDPLGGAAQPVRDIPPSGHIAGTISQLDRDRGAHSTPANSALAGILDLREDYDDDEHALLNQDGIDLIRCVPALGFSVWGGRTLDRTERNRFVAHRRLIHRLVRAIRRVAEPLVFETNGPLLWFAFVRAITAVLLAAWRAGALAGDRPEEAFDVTCDETTNPPEQIDTGRCICLIEVAPAIPMEFILIRVALDRDGTLEVL